MSDNRKIFYINFDTANLIDSEGAIVMGRPSISCGANPQWELHFCRVNNDGTLSGADLSEAVAWQSAADIDFLSGTQPMIRTLDSDIDHSKAASGIITVDLDANTTTFFEKVNGRNSVNAYFEIRGRNSEDKVLYDYRFNINCLGAVDYAGGEPLPVVSGGVTESQVMALLRSAPEYEFSNDGVEWHEDQRPGDIYYHSRYPEGAWSDPIELVAGSDGADGYNVKFEYSVNGTSGWHTPATSADFYMRTSSDNGEHWTVGLLFKGTNGVGYKILGAYNSSTTYNPYTASGYYECVTYEGSTYAYTANAAASGNPPTDTTHWTLIAAKGDTGSVDNITTSNITDLDSYMSGQLSGYQKAGTTYTTAQIDNMMSAKANLVDVYTKTEADDLFVDINEINSITGTFVQTDQWSSKNSEFQAEINYLSGQISGGGGGDLSNYYTKSEVNSISAYLQNEIDNIPSGGGGSVITGGISGVNLNGTPLQNNNGFVNVTALPFFTSMPAPSSTQLEHLLYLGETMNGDAYNGKLYTTDDPYNRDEGLQLQCDYILTGNARVWTGLGNNMLSHWFKVAYANGQWEFYESQDSSGTPIGYEKTGVLSYPYASGQPWGEYTVSSQYGITSGAGFTWTLTPYTGFTAAENGCIYKHISNDSNKIIFRLGNGWTYNLVKSSDNDYPNYWFDEDRQESDPWDRVRLYWQESPSGDEGRWYFYESSTTYFSEKMTFCQPWEINGQQLEPNNEPDTHYTIYVERVYNLGAWKPINKLPSYI